MKKFLYIFLFVIFGVLISFLVHAAIEMPVIYVLIQKYEPVRYGFSWSQWFLIHQIFTVITLIIGIGVGYWLGQHWWNKIYEKKK